MWYIKVCSMRGMLCEVRSAADIETLMPGPSTGGSVLTTIAGGSTDSRDISYIKACCSCVHVLESAAQGPRVAVCEQATIPQMSMQDH